MKYLLLMYAAEADVPKTPEEQQVVMAEWKAITSELEAAGVMISTGGLPQGTVTTVRVRDGKSLITDGPFAETHEQLGGYFLLDCKDLDEAIQWANKIPYAKYGSIEIRPLWGQGS